MKEKTTLILKTIIMLLISLSVLLLIIHIIGQLQQPSYTIQDVYNWCCRNINQTSSPTGENCTNVINNIYGGSC